MIKIIINKFTNMDIKVKTIMINGFKFSFMSLLFSILILSIYHINLLPILFDCGTILFKTSLVFFVDFIIMGVGFDTIKKQIV